MYGQRNFMIISVDDLGSVNFSEVLETSPDTVRRSVDGTRTFVKWDGESVPPSVDSVESKEGPYGYDEMVALLSGPEWTKPISPEFPPA